MTTLEEDRVNSDIERLESSLEKEPGESSECKKGDPQIISLKTSLSSILTEIKLPKLIDFGCGKGTLIQILTDIQGFNTKNGAYIGINKTEIGEDVSVAFVKSGFYKNHESLLLNYEDFLKSNDINCNIIVIKNVIHEIVSIKELGEIINQLLKILQRGGRILIQDMEKLPYHELGNCPYVVSDLKELFEENGLECITIPYESFSGIPLYTLIGKKNKEPKSAKQISERLLTIRKSQLISIKGELYKQIENKKADRGVQCIGQSLDFVAIQKQIENYTGEATPLFDFEKSEKYSNFNDENNVPTFEDKSKSLQKKDQLPSGRWDFALRLDELKKIVKDSYSQCTFVHTPHFAIHSDEHFLAMETLLENFLRTNSIKLNEYEDFLLRAAIWLHDIGMLGQEDYEEDQNEIRKNHHIRSQEIINSEYGRAVFHLNHFESHIIGILSYLHRKSMDIRLVGELFENCLAKLSYCKKDKTPTNFEIQIDKLAMLLRLLDVFAFNNRNLLMPEILEFAKIPNVAMHYFARHLITSVNFEKEKIIINSIVPPTEYGVISREEIIITDLFINDVRREIDSLEWILRKYNLYPIIIEHKPHRRGIETIPIDIYDQYLNYRNLLYKDFEYTPRNQAFEYTLRSLEKNVCISKNGHCIIDIVSDFFVNKEEGITRINHAFSADDSSPPEFKYANFDLMKEAPSNNIFDKQSIFADVLNSYGKAPPKINIIEADQIIGNPHKYKEFYLSFSPKLEKNTRLKYGYNLVLPDFVIINNPEKFIFDSHFLRVPTTFFTLNLKFEKGLVIKDLYFIICDINNNVLFEQKLKTFFKIITDTKICDGYQGECSYSRDKSLHYDIHRFKINFPQLHTVIKIKYKFDI